MRLFWREPRFAWQASVGSTARPSPGPARFLKDCWRLGASGLGWIFGRRFYPAARLAKGRPLSLILISLASSKPTGCNPWAWKGLEFFFHAGSALRQWQTHAYRGIVP